MATFVFNTGFNLSTDAQFYDFLDTLPDSASSTRITYTLPFNGTQIYNGIFQKDISGNVSSASRIDSVIELDAQNNPVWSVTDLALSANTFEEYIQGGLNGINNSDELLTFTMRGNDKVTGSSAADSAILFAGNDSFIGFDGDDIVNGHFGNDTLNGHFGNDTVRGGADDDVVRGGAGNDFLTGDKGNDQLLGDLGNDTMNGGSGADQFIFKTSSGMDVITDFSSEDQLLLYTRPGFDAVSDLDIEVINGSTVITLGAGETITLQNVIQFDTSDITIIG